MRAEKRLLALIRNGTLPELLRRRHGCNVHAERASHVYNNGCAHTTFALFHNEETTILHQGLCFFIYRPSPSEGHRMLVSERGNQGVAFYPEQCIKEIPTVFLQQLASVLPQIFLLFGTFC